MTATTLLKIHDMIGGKKKNNRASRTFTRDNDAKFPNRAVFKWLSKVITWLRLLRLVIGLKDSRHFFNQWEAKPKPIAPHTRDFSRALSELQVIARIVIGSSRCSLLLWLVRVIALLLVFRQSSENRSKEFKQGQRQRWPLKTMIWFNLVEWGKIIVLHVRHALKHNFLTSSVQRRRKFSTTTWTHNTKSFIFYIYFNGASTSLFAACSVNNKGCEEEPIITK